MKTTEKQIQDLMIDYLRLQHKTYVWRQNAGSMFVDSPTGRHGFRASSAKGISDIIGVWHGIPLAIEVKRPGNKPTELQWEFLKRFQEAGGLSIVAYSLNGLKNALKTVEEMQDPFNGMMIKEVV